ncbi:hypothetical protein DPMN_137373, partial [Dreissena polymorpha]
MQSRLPTCKPYDCGSAAPVNGVATAHNGTTYQKQATVQCNPGYTLRGPSVIECNATGWNESVSCNQKRADDILEIERGKKKNIERTLKADYNALVEKKLKILVGIVDENVSFCFGFIADEATDAATMEKMALCLRFYDAEKHVSGRNSL